MSKSTCPPPYEEYGNFETLEVNVGDNFEEAVRTFKSMVQRSKILTEFKERQSYEKPSEKKRRKKREAEERRRLSMLKERLIASGEWNKRQNKKSKRNNFDDYE